MAGEGTAAQLAPEKQLFRIGEAARLTATKTFVLRYWETEFPMLQPVKSPSGHRLYRREDIETVIAIKRLLYEEGFTIAGARKWLAEKADNPHNAGANGETKSAAPAGHEATPASAAPLRKLDHKLLLDLREELAAILTLLEGEC